jgi:hypothetical protein
MWLSTFRVGAGLIPVEPCFPHGDETSLHAGRQRGSGGGSLGCGSLVATRKQLMARKSACVPARSATGPPRRFLTKACRSPVYGEASARMPASARASDIPTLLPFLSDQGVCGNKVRMSECFRQWKRRRRMPRLASSKSNCQRTYSSVHYCIQVHYVRPAHSQQSDSVDRQKPSATCELAGRKQTNCTLSFCTNCQRWTCPLNAECQHTAR